MAKYRGVDGWIYYESEERPRRYKKDDPVGHAPKAKKKSNVLADKAFTAALLGCAALAILLPLAIIIGAVRKLLSWLWG